MNRNYLKQLLEGAGLGHLPWLRVVGLTGAALVGLALTLVKATGVLGIGIAGLVLGAAATIEALQAVGSARSRAMVSALPEVAEALAAGVAAGEELGEALARMATNGPRPLRASFHEFARLLSIGYSLEQALAWLQLELANENADILVQFLQQSLRLGGTGLVANLNNLAQVIRGQAALDGEIAAKQGWVIGTAKLGIASPWLIVLFLNQRPEAHAYYASADGATLLVVGLAVCAAAYAIILRMARLPKPKRVLNAAL